MIDKQKKIHIRELIKFIIVTVIYGTFYAVYFMGLDQIKNYTIRSMLYALSVFYFNLIFHDFKHNHNLFYSFSKNVTGYLGVLLSLIIFVIIQWLLIYHNVY